MKKVVYLLVGILVLILIVNAVLIKEPIPLDELKEKYADEFSHYVELKGLDVHYKEKGEGMPILLIHGTSASLQTWELWEEKLSKEYKTYSIDMQGGGLTTPPTDDDYSMDAYLDLIDDFVEYKGIDSFYLAGNSLGGHTVWEYAVHARNADKVKKIILVDPSGFFLGDADRPLVFKLAQYDFLFKIIEHINVTPFVKKSLKEVFYDNDIVTPKMVQTYADLQHRAGNRRAFFVKIRKIQQGEVNDLKKISCPTLIQWGREDEWIPLVLADIFTANIPNNRLIVYDNVGHIPMEEIPEKSVNDVLDFLSE